MFTQIKYFFTDRIWEIRVRDLPPARRCFFRYLRVFALALHGFWRDTCTMRASALTYYSLLSVVPVIAMIFGIAKGFGLQRVIQSQIIDMAEKASWSPEIVEKIIAFSNSLLAKTKGGLIAGIGFITLFWAVVSILSNIEDAFNHIWDVRKSRTFLRKITDYMTIVILTPIFLVISGSLTVIVAGKAAVIVERIALLGPLSPVIFFFLKLLPYVSMWTVLVLIYMVIPNTRVPFKSAILAGIVTGSIYQLVQLVYIKFQIGIANYGAVYGSFAALPLFVTWLQLSWMIVFYGAEIAVADEFGETYGFHPDLSKISVASRKRIVLQICQVLAQRFFDGESPLTAREISRRVEVPVKLTRQLLDELVGVGLVAETGKNGARAIAYQPARSIDHITAHAVIHAWEGVGLPRSHGVSPGEGEKIAAYLDVVAEAFDRSPHNVPVKDIGSETVAR